MRQQQPCNEKYLKTLTSQSRGSTTSEKLIELFWNLYNYFGPQYWWPGQSPFEIAIGAILTQNTNWQNVEKAITNLKSHGLLSHKAILEIPHGQLAQLIRPAGYFNVKAKRIKNFVNFIEEEFQGDMQEMTLVDTTQMRQKLLSVNGIGPETADSILLYALEKPVFVVDTYTVRILARHDMIYLEEAQYHLVQDLFMENLPMDTCLFNEYHALFVRLGKEMCKRTRPICNSCPLNGL